jgi:hypothetical protein
MENDGTYKGKLSEDYQEILWQASLNEYILFKLKVNVKVFII